jgi:hypothetical protein
MSAELHPSTLTATRPGDPPVEPMHPEADYTQNVRADDYVALDPFFGVERVVRATGHGYSESAGVWLYKFQLAYQVPGHPERTRFVVKAESEPITVWRDGWGPGE